MYIAPGRYRHYKGQLYEVMGIARHSETEEQLVVYRALYGDFGLWVRPLDLFNQDVEKDGKTLPRFDYLEAGNETESSGDSEPQTGTSSESTDRSSQGAAHLMVESMDDEITEEVFEAEKAIHERYEWLHIANDYTSALLFLVGSIFFLWDSMQIPATWLFIIGSVVFLNGPFLRTLNKHYVKHIRKDPIHW